MTDNLTSLALTQHQIRLMIEALQTHLIEVRDAAGHYPWLTAERESDIRALIARLQDQLPPPVLLTQAPQRRIMVP